MASLWPKKKSLWKEALHLKDNLHDLSDLQWRKGLGNGKKEDS
jgi:hypothetical protein